MKKNVYRVFFGNCNYSGEYVTVSAFNQDDAVILAKGERILEDKDHTLDYIAIVANNNKAELPG
jgi:hypothetical protein